MDNKHNWILFGLFCISTTINTICFYVLKKEILFSHIIKCKEKIAIALLIVLLFFTQLKS